jgi:Ca-activated chloride channel homolog
MKTVLIILIFSSFIVLNVIGQVEKKQIREGNKLYNSKKYRQSEVSYLKAMKKDPKSFKAAFNLGDALYKQEKYEEATKQFTDVSAKSGDKTNSAKVYHNLGNSYLLQNKIDESINSYKSALRNNPTDLDTKYNLAYAQMMKKKQQQQQQQKNQQNQQKQDQQKQQQQQQKQDQKKDDQKQKQQQQDQQISKDDADRMLQALQDDEKNTQDKVKKMQVQNRNKNIEKDW